MATYPVSLTRPYGQFICSGCSHTYSTAQLSEQHYAGDWICKGCRKKELADDDARILDSNNHSCPKSLRE